MTIEKVVEVLNSSPDDIDEKAFELIQLYHRADSPEQREELAHEVVDKLAYLIFTLPFFLTDNAKLFRGRLIGSMNQLFYAKDRLLYPPDKDNIKLGRANAEGEQILYACLDNPITIYSELSCEEESTLNLLTFKAKEGEKIIVAPIGQIDHIRRYGKAYLAPDEYTNLLRDILDKLSSPVRLAAYLADAFFADEFSKPDPKFDNEETDYSQYYITSLIAKEMMQSGNTPDGIIYPSVKLAGGYNVALTPDAFHSKCELTGFEGHFITKNLGYGMMTVHTYAHGTIIDDEDGRLRWQWEVQKYANAKTFL